MAGQQHEYAFDDIGNRSTAKAGGDENGANLRTVTYAPNRLNQYTSRTFTSGRYLDVVGLANAGQSVTVNGAAAYRKGDYFRGEVNVAGSAAAFQSVSVTTGGGGAQSGSLFVPATPEPWRWRLAAR